MIVVTILIILCVFTLVPAGLIEFRYYTVALLFVYNEIKITTQGINTIMTWVFMIVNICLIYVFVARPYSCYGSLNCRFMFWFVIYMISPAEKLSLCIFHFFSLLEYVLRWFFRLFMEIIIIHSSLLLGCLLVHLVSVFGIVVFLTFLNMNTWTISYSGIWGGLIFSIFL